MVKKTASLAPGESETDDVVRRWLDRQGIDQALVSGYSIFRHQGELPRIMLEMYFDDTPGPEPVESAHDGETAEGRDFHVSHETSACCQEADCPDRGDHLSHENGE